MPIRINLLAEDQAAEEMRRKDPVKRSIWVGSFVVFLVLLWGLTIFLKSIIARAELSSSEGRWKSMEKKVKQIEVDRKQTAEIEKKQSALTQFTTNRFLWANALNALQDTLVDNIQIIRLKSEQVYVGGEGAKPPPGVPAAAAGPAHSRAGFAVEKIVVHLDGRDFSERVAERVPQFKESLANSSFFQACLQKTNSVMLTSLSAPQAEKKGPCVVFGLQLNLQDKERRLYE